MSQEQDWRKLPPKTAGMKGSDSEHFHMPKRKKADGHAQGYEPVQPLDPRKISSVSDLVTAMGKTSFTGRKVGEAADLLHTMVTDPDCKVVCTLSGAMTVAKMSLLVCEMIERGMIHCIVSTGALMAHGLVEAGGMTHFKVPDQFDDFKLFAEGYDRVYDTLELEKNLDDAEAFLLETLADHDPAEHLSSWKILKLLGKNLATQHPDARGILISAHKHDVPIYIPAFTDSELGLDFALLNRRRLMADKKPFVFDAIDDLESYARFVDERPKLGIFTIGGGVPRNWAQQAGPYLDLIANRLHGGKEGFHPFLYGVRICPDPPHYGHLSGCTYSEGVSWGKFVPAEQGGRWVEVLADATVAWPLIVQAVCERLDSAK